MSMDDEAKALYNKWQAQQNALAGGGSQLTGDPSIGVDQSPHLYESGNIPNSPDQTPLNPVNSVRPMGVNTPQNSVAPTPISPAQAPMPAQSADVCRECGTMHPPLPHGQKCPNAGVAQTTTNNPNAIDDVAINKHLVDMRNIIMSQITGKNIQNQKKFFQYAVVELTKALESYNE